MIGIPNEDFGEEVKAVVQLVDGVEGEQRSFNELVTFCGRGSLPSSARGRRFPHGVSEIPDRETPQATDQGRISLHAGCQVIGSQGTSVCSGVPETAVVRAAARTACSSETAYRSARRIRAGSEFRSLGPSMAIWTSAWEDVETALDGCCCSGGSVERVCAKLSPAALLLWSTPAACGTWVSAAHIAGPACCLDCCWWFRLQWPLS